MNNKLYRIPDLTESEFYALFWLFSEGLHHTKASISPAAMGALHALQSVRKVDFPES
jgi:hypothetical protein